jgi:hypothetical protein
MAGEEDMGAHELQFKYQGILDMAGLFSVVTDWFETRGYEITIPQVKHKAKTFGFEDEYKIMGWRDETDLHRVQIEFYMHMWDANQVEVIVDGQKKQLMKGRFYMALRGKLAVDYFERFDSSILFKGLRKFMMKMVLKHRYDAIWTDLIHYKMHEIQNNIKEFLDMQSKGKYFKNMW